MTAVAQQRRDPTQILYCSAAAETGTGQQKHEILSGSVDHHPTLTTSVVPVVTHDPSYLSYDPDPSCPGAELHPRPIAEITAGAPRHTPTLGRDGRARRKNGFGGDCVCTARCGVVVSGRFQ